MTTIPPSPFPRKGVTLVQPLRGFHDVGSSPPWGGPAEGRRARGFTLIELLVVMAIVALLLAVAAPRYFTHLDRAKEAALRQTLAVTRDAIDQFHADAGRYPESLEELVDKRYLRKLPVDPLLESSAEWRAVPPPAGATGSLYDLKSGAPGSGADGTPYADW